MGDGFGAVVVYEENFAGAGVTPQRIEDTLHTRAQKLDSVAGRNHNG
jgi:hypothetical protein